MNDVQIWDARTASLEEIAEVFGVSLDKAELIQLMERGEYHGDVQAVDLQGNPMPEDPAPSSREDRLRQPETKQL